MKTTERDARLEALEETVGVMLRVIAEHDTAAGARLSDRLIARTLWADYARRPRLRATYRRLLETAAHA